MHSLQRVTLFSLAAAASLACMAAPDQSADAESKVPEVFPTATRDNKVWQQDDHIHTTPDQAELRFGLLDLDSDRRLQWGEMQMVDMEKEIFIRLDTDGSGDLDREEYIAISPSPENDYTAEAMAEP